MCIEIHGLCQAQVTWALFIMKVSMEKYQCNLGTEIVPLRKIALCRITYRFPIMNIIEGLEKLRLA